VNGFYFSEFMRQIRDQAKAPCVCGQSHQVLTREILVSPTSLGESAERVSGAYGTKACLWVLSDQNTEDAAGAAWKRAAGGVTLVSRILPAAPRVHPTMALAGQLAAEARAARPDLLVAVGSGVVSDLVKRVSLDIACPNWCIATAPSVDAYTSATSTSSRR
jgi:glycerol-1-phosphate dehydrogenase [NAD(P)+]